MISVQRKFIAIVEQRSISKAAALLHISQPALTIALQKHEKELGVTLIDREATPIKVTTAGQAVYEVYCAEQTLESGLTGQLQLLKGAKPSLTIGMIDGVASRLAESPSILEQLEMAVRLRLVVDNSRVLLKAVHDRTIDMALITADQPVSDAQTTFLANETLALITHPANVDRITNEMAAGVLQSFIAYDAPSATHRLIAAFFRQLGVRLAPELSSTSTEVMTRLVTSGRGSACVPFHAVRDDVLAGRLRLITWRERTVLVARPIYVVSQNHYHVPVPLQAFLAQLGAAFTDRPETF